MMRLVEILLHMLFSKIGMKCFENDLLISLYMFFFLQEAPDFINSLSLKVEVEQQNADANPVLDQFSPTAWEFFVSD